MTPLRPRAFTLVELLAVIAMISVVLALIVPALGGGTSKNLTAGGNLVTDLASRAREEAISRNAMVALVLLNGSSRADWNNRLFILVERTAGVAAWSPVTAWTSLPTGVVVNGTESASFTGSTNIPSVGTLNLPPYAGTAITASQCAYQVFLPGGGLSVSGITTPVPPRLRFAPVGSGGARDYYDLTLNLYTGIPKADRP